MLGRLNMRTSTAIAILILLASFSARAESILRVSHLQHFYAGGGGCAERFWFEWLGSDSEIRNLDLSIEVSSKGEDSVTSVLHIDRIGFTTADNTIEGSIETPSCLSGHPRLVIRTASAVVGKERINLLKSGILRVGRIERLPLTIGGPTHHSTGPARKAAQAGEFRR
jgi:hypothetical protein